MGCQSSKLTTVTNTQDFSSSNPIIQTNYGLVEGKTYQTKEGFISNIFLGIPFASPPVGELRFKKPIPPSKWDGILLAKKYKSRSIQKDIYIEPITITNKKNEDCLYLNIVTPDLSNKSNNIKYPVMIYIHGGGFTIDCAARYDYKKITQTLVKHDVIVVTIQYRLGFLGFFYTGDEACPSNLGLWDQYMALKWIHENIQYFGGDINNITVFGQSAGAVSADILALSPITRDMFQKVILMGGNADTIWGIGDKDKLIEICRNKAIRLGFKKLNNDEWSKEDNIEMMKFLMKIPGEKFGNTMLYEAKYFKEGTLDNAPIVDGEFLPKPINELRKEVSPKCCIIGVCKYEGLLFMGLYKWKINEKLKNKLINNVIEFFEKSNIKLTNDEALELGNLKNVSTKNKKAYKKKIVTLFGDIVNNIAMRRYCQESIEHRKTLINNKNSNIKRNSYSSGDSGFGDKSVSSESINFSNSFSSEKETSKTAPLYLYRFDHFNKGHLMAFKLHLPFVSATHSTELFYVFGVNLFVVPFYVTEKDKMVMNNVGIWWSNFAKYGNPNGNENTNNNETFLWKPITDDSLEELNYLKIKYNPEMGKDFGGPRIKRFADLFEKASRMQNNVENFVN
ncbi:Carboxylesterase, type B domain-containing protein [Strongyloides ratti]|uniref:Carboxylic ester hydrolase n=1 Tax=Strongyloides ratti TaxID=34506 RepID=A0A090MU76_STRRB|nr:Carboxylesterase, type B domain-containing protein [Strongyloides ratti]CEF62043.1 Carboxylesterase, type B domain-containing protein [Strongyloides ratti]